MLYYIHLSLLYKWKCDVHEEFLYRRHSQLMLFNQRKNPNQWNEIKLVISGLDKNFPINHESRAYLRDDGSRYLRQGVLIHVITEIVKRGFIAAVSQRRSDTTIRREQRC